MRTLLAFALALGGCSKADGIVVVSVGSLAQLDSVAYLDCSANISDDGRTAVFKVGNQGPPFSIPPTKTFGIDVPGSYTGTLSLTVTARKADGTSLGSGDGATPLGPADRRDLNITIGVSTLDGGVDGGTVDLVGADLTGVDLTSAIPDMTMLVQDLGDYGCIPGVASDRCGDPNTLYHCQASGTFTSTACSLGCEPAAPAHCGAMYPTAPVASTDLTTQFVVDVTFSGTVTVHTDTGQIETNIRAPNSNPANNEILSGIAYRKESGIGIFTFKTLTIASGATVHLLGTNPVAFVSQGNMSVVGVIDAQGACGNSTPVAGGYYGGTPGTPGNKGQGPGAGGGGPGGGGGGGGGHGDIGGRGGLINGGMMTGVAGTTYDVAALTVLEGGSGGGGGGGSNGGTGGAGGGAVQLVSGGTLTIGNGSAKGGVNTSGCGAVQSFFGQGGAGGGSGGAILVEAVNIHITATGVLAANGGGGSSDGATGNNGQFSSAQAPVAMSSSGTNGGYGGATTINNGGAGGDTVTGGQSGGGGGGVGRVRLNTRTASAVVDSGGIISPSLNDTTSQSSKAATQGTVDIH